MAIVLVGSISLAFAFLTAEKGVVDREKNMFEILGVKPFASGAEIEEGIARVFGNTTNNETEIFEALTQRNYQVQYYRFGEIDQRMKSAGEDSRFFVVASKYIILLFVSIVFVGDEIPSAKRFCLIFTILFIIYEVTLYATLEERDIILELFPEHYWLFEIVKYLHVVFVYIFLCIVGILSVNHKSQNLDTENEKNKLLEEVSQNMTKISTKIKEISQKLNKVEDAEDDLKSALEAEGDD